MNQKLIMTKGLPASGKTTWSMDMVKTGKGHYKRVNKDDLRMMIDGGKWSKEREKLIVQLRNTIVYHALADGHSVIVDDTNLAPKHEINLKKFVEDYNQTFKSNVEFEVKDFPIQLEDALKRDAKRGDKAVGSEVIFRMYNQFIRPQYEEVQNPKLPRTIICDLDGTICLHNNRSPYEYHKCDTDSPNEPVIDIVKRYPHHIWFFSGREGSQDTKDKTIDWLIRHGLYSEGRLQMREEGDTRKDYVVKKELYDKHIKDQYYVDFVLDDRNQVVNLWRDLGFCCLQVNDGDF